MTNNQVKAKWEKTVIDRLVQKGEASCRTQIKSILECGTAIFKCGRRVKSNISLFQFSALHAF
jgi:hypothetical protein